VYYSSENILVSDPGDLSKVKIADLGLSIKVDVNSSKPYDHCGTLLYMAPEVIRKHPYNKPVDVWSCAVIMFMLFNDGAHPLGIKSKVNSDEHLNLMKHRWPKLRDQYNIFDTKLDWLRILSRSYPNTTPSIDIQ
jgi:serine/threonine protein kinase